LSLNRIRTSSGLMRIAVASARGRLPCLAWASNGWLYYFAVGPAITSIGAWRPGQRAAGRLRLDIDWAVDVVPNTLAAN
jgi:hypothetical protein